LQEEITKLQAVIEEEGKELQELQVGTHSQITYVD
jgi:hypothetical protein